MIYHTSPPTKFEELGIIQMACSVRAPSLAREAINDWLGGAHAAREIAILAASELVTNAVKYADTAGTGESSGDEIMLRLSQDALVLRLAVTDPGSRSSMPARIPLQVPDVDSERGRGLAIVEIVSRGRWGSYRMSGSGFRLVWCHLDRHPTATQMEDLFRAPV
ncbi:ATP-binding protein [Nonomuraea sp. NPDC001699]